MMLRTSKNLKKQQWHWQYVPQFLLYRHRYPQQNQVPQQSKELMKNMHQKNCYPNQNIHMERTLCMTLTGMAYRKCFLNT